MTSSCLFLSLTIFLAAAAAVAHGFSARLASTRPLDSRQLPSQAVESLSFLEALSSSTTVDAPTRERTDRSSASDEDSYDDDIEYYGNDELEYNIDLAVSRELHDPYHILLLGTTFEKPKITIPYVSSSLEYVLNMPELEAKDLSKFAQEQGLSCLGTWTREECLSLGRKLQLRDLVCRVVPYTVGGQRGWQAKNANEELGRVSSD
ncbi:hypothetical protein MPSEU_000509700 [Mayamaea pseudoterrestris]|nr:hypothetical protein MPSEU_000509700 [Mayamaea pseudoterrestris]